MYDYVIVGAGSAGCVLANRLSEDPDVKVLLLEAGPPDTNDLIHIPAAFSALFRTQQDWDHSSGYEPGCNKRRIYLPRGKMLGGSSSINAMIYIRGNRQDYDDWAADGAEGWSYDDLLPYFRKAEDNVRGADDFHGSGGPLHVEEGHSRNVINAAFLEAAAANGQTLNPDFNGPDQEGFGWYQTTTRNGARGSAAVSYLHPVADRPNLTIETHVEVLKITFDGTRATGVVGQRLSELLEFKAEREVILSGGAYNSPHLLQLSGIGRSAELTELEIETVSEVPGVGMNLQDHPNCGAVYKCSTEDTLFGALNEENLARWQEGSGPLTSTVAESGGFIRTRDDLTAPDIQFHFAAAMFGDEGLVPGQEHGLALGGCVLKPKSTGYVVPVTPDPTGKPLIVHNYYEHPDDMQSAVAGLRMTLELMRTSPLAEYVAGPHNVPASDSEEDLIEHIRATTQTLYHPVGTCKMGTDAMAVTDLELRVHGVEGLRVVDASVMPSVPRGNTNAPTIAIAERAADLIRGRTPASAAAAEQPAGAAA